ncbi:unnamed protein product [Toxocara canis]|uniref:Peptidase_M1_N domain-containing protein n=1 Tax=Toxocara canis TaxID=6265 RepID=A0A183TWJ1_TOXCA|nr:unnamed protein product [Toxocara canis]
MAKSTAVRFESGLTVRVQLFVVVIVVLLIAVALALIFLPPSSVHDAQRIRSGTTKSIPKSEVQSSASKGSSSSDRYIRLPSSNFPTLYTLKLQLFLPYREVFDFGIRNYTTEGDLRIDFKCIESNDRIVLNAKHINIDASSILIVNDVNRSISFAAINTYRYEPDDIYAIEFRLDSFLIAGNSYSVYLKYHGRIGDVWAGGLYKADYDIDGETRTLAATQLQPTDASRVLPCFDEPEMKANFLITIIHPAGTTAISNSPARRIRNISRQWSETEFEKTPKMSTYLLAIAVSDFVFRFRLCKNIEVIRNLL